MMSEVNELAGRVPASDEFHLCRALALSQAELDALLVTDAANPLHLGKQAHPVIASPQQPVKRPITPRPEPMLTVPLAVQQLREAAASRMAEKRARQRKQWKERQKSTPRFELMPEPLSVEAAPVLSDYARRMQARMF